MDNDQQLIKIVPDNGAISILQTQELPEDSNLLKDLLSVHLKNDERLFDAQYMAIKSYDGNRNSFDMYRIVNELVPDNATEFEGVQVAPYELEGVVVEDLRPQGWTIERTTNQILKDSDWRLGYVDDNLPTVTTNFYYLSAKDSLKKLQELTGVEFTFKVEISGNKITDKWVEVYKELGNRTLKRFNYGTNALTVKRETNHSELYTALIGRGKGEEVGETDAGDATYGRKINFADVEWKKSAGKPVDKPKGQKYIELPQATAEFGVKMLDGRKVPRIGMVEFSETEDPEVLIEQTWQALQEYARPKVLFSATVANIGDTGIGDTVTIHRHDLNMHYKTRVRKVMRNRKNNDKTQVEIGDVVYTASTKRQSNLNSKLNNMENELSNVRDEVSHVVISADGKNTINYGNSEPERKKIGDSWVRDHPSLAGETQWLVWNGEAWELILDTSETTLNKEAIEQAQADIESAREQADEAVEQIDTAVANAGFTSLDETISSVQTISNQAQINAGTAIDHSLEAIQQASLAVENTGSLNVRVDDVEGTLELKADKQEVNTLSGIVDAHTLDIQANAEGLALKANQDTVDTLAGTVQSLGTEFDIVAGQVNSRVWNTDIETAIDGIEVGGRNYALGTSNEFKDVRVSKYSGSLSDAKVTSKYEYSLKELNLEAGNKITVRLFVGESEEGFGGHIRVDDDSSKIIFNGSTSPVVNDYAIATITVPENINGLKFYLTRDRSNSNYVVPVKEFKIEKGTKATDWTPAPEDTDAKIDHIETEWTQTFDTFSQTVAGIDGRVTSQKQTIDSITQTVTDQTGKIATVEQNLNGIQQTVSDPVNGLVTQVSTLASGFNVLAKDFEDLEVGGRNLIGGFNTESKKWINNDGSIVGLADGFISDYIDVTSISYITITQEYTSDIKTKSAVAFYDENRSFLNRPAQLTDDKAVTVDIPENVFFIRYSGKSTSGSYEEGIKLEKGNKATDWTPAPEDMATQAQLSVLNDNINLRVEKGDVINQINISDESILLQANRIQALGDVVVDGKLTITDEFIAANAQIDGAKIADATIGSAKIANLDVDKISGNITNFVQSAWNTAAGGSVNITGSGIVSTSDTGSTARIQNGVFLSTQPNGASVGYIGHAQTGSSPRFTVQTSLGSHFQVRQTYIDPNGDRANRQTLLMNANETLLDTDNFEIIGRTRRLGFGFRHYISGTSDTTFTLTAHSTLILRARESSVFAISNNGTSNSASLYANLNMQRNTVTNTSDERLKTDIKRHVDSSLDKINRFNFVDFKWIEGGKQDFGLIAQQLQRIDSYLVVENEDGYLGLHNHRINMMTTHALQELAFEHDIIAQLAESNESKIHNLQQELSEANRRISDQQTEIEVLKEKIAS